MIKIIPKGTKNFKSQDKIIDIKSDYWFNNLDIPNAESFTLFMKKTYKRGFTSIRAKDSVDLTNVNVKHIRSKNVKLSACQVEEVECESLVCYNKVDKVTIKSKKKKSDARAKNAVVSNFLGILKCEKCTYKGEIQKVKIRVINDELRLEYDGNEIYCDAFKCDNFEVNKDMFTGQCNWLQCLNMKVNDSKISELIGEYSTFKNCEIDEVVKNSESTFEDCRGNYEQDLKEQEEEKIKKQNEKDKLFSKTFLNGKPWSENESFEFSELKDGSVIESDHSVTICYCDDVHLKIKAPRVFMWDCYRSTINIETDVFELTSSNVYIEKQKINKLELYAASYIFKCPFDNVDISFIEC